VTFTETGLLGGTSWSVTLNGNTESSTGATIVFDEPNGTYSYTVGAVPGYTVHPTGGLVTVSAGPVSVPVTFTVVTYTVTFSETGLPGGTSWSVTLNGVTQSTTGTSTAFTEPNGSYSYTVGAVPGYTAHPSSGIVNVVGASSTVSVSFTRSVGYALAFVEFGLPIGTMWTVHLGNGQSLSSTAFWILFSEPNGTYTYTFSSADPSYSASGGSTTVHGHVVMVFVYFSKHHSTPEVLAKDDLRDLPPSVVTQGLKAVQPGRLHP
jgi:hypothetical protein